MSPSQMKRRYTYLFLILPLLSIMILKVEGKRYSENEDNEDYNSNNYDQYNDNDQVQNQNENENENANYNTSNENEFRWLSPLNGDLSYSGKPLKVIWKSNNKLNSPSISLCTFNLNLNTPDCGDETWPIIENVNDQNQNQDQNQTFSTIVTMPIISQTIEKLYLSLNSDGKMFNSPVFGLQGNSGSPNAYLASPVTTSLTSPTSITTAFSTASVSLNDLNTGINGDLTDSTEIITSIITSGKSKSTIKATPISTITLYTSMNSQPQIQSPLQATLPPYLPISTQSIIKPNSNSNIAAASEIAGNIATVKENSQIGIKVIALPITICGIIFIISLIYCARSKVFKKNGSVLNNNKNIDKDVEKNWQDVIKEKASTGLPISQSFSTVTKGIEVIKNDYANERDYVIPSLGNKGRQCSDRSSERERYCKDEERFTRIPKVNHERSDRVDERRYIEDERYRERERRHRCNDTERCSRGHYDRRDEYRRRDKKSKDFYSTSRRSSSGIGGWYDDEYDKPKSKDRSRRESAYFDRESSYSIPNRQSSNSIPDRNLYFLSRDLDNYENSRKYSDRTLYSTASRRSSNERPNNQRNNESYLSNKSRELTNPFDPKFNENKNRPLPEPRIRSLTKSSISSNSLREEEEEYDLIKQKTLPHLSGGLRDDSRLYSNTKSKKSKIYEEREREREFESDTEAGWELANQGKYVTGEEGMSELYESLRIAIQQK
ncbi:uncharacterized protein I206_107267 [Kwoniella pini CBS 10737]|uniref:Mid2 domain-containing protein n=1 Tax=Kwoniella pini CBS 10737 TaxID=1296096 RepID=A0A1B9HYT9_9TREE|nr:uncharacterized protein I206_05188 [Kwoniella pini CBS 10737]OCF48411.1 hypothetical protein I206_05188 [Kwoniella pini CBS 10737]